MNKHIIIAGCTRTGKTTLARMFRSEGFNHYKMDTIKRGIENNFVEGNFKLWSEVSCKMAKLIERIILESRTDLTVEDHYVIDTCHVYPKDLAKLKLENVIIVYLGYPDITKEEKLKYIRKYDKKNTWSPTKSDEFFLENTPLDIEFSKDALEECKKYNIAFFDTSKNFKKTILDAYKYIKERLGE